MNRFKAVAHCEFRPSEVHLVPFAIWRQTVGSRQCSDYTSLDYLPRSPAPNVIR